MSIWLYTSWASTTMKKKETGDFPKKKIWEVRWSRSGWENGQRTTDREYKDSRKDAIIQTLVTLSHGHSVGLEVLGLISNSTHQSELQFWVPGEPFSPRKWKKLLNLSLTQEMNAECWTHQLILVCSNCCENGLWEDECSEFFRL